jgi:hypothetical protein
MVCFEVINPLLLQLCTKTSHYTFRVPTPVCDSQQNQALVEDYLRPAIEYTNSQLLKRFSKIMRMHPFFMDAGHLDTPIQLNFSKYLDPKNNKQHIFYFSEDAFREFDTLNPQADPKAPLLPIKYPHQNSPIIFFLETPKTLLLSQRTLF